MILVDRLRTLPQRLPPFPMWLLMVLLGLAIMMTLVMVMRTAEFTHRLEDAERTEQRTLQRQQLEATQALVEEVRRLRVLIEARSTSP